MEIREIADKKIWEDFFQGQKDKTFLQSWNWGEVQQGLGNKIWRLGIYDDELVFAALITKIQAKRGTFLLVQHLIQDYNLKLEIFKILSSELKIIGKEEGATFVRIAPLWERTEENQKNFKSLGFKDSPMHASAYEATLKLDITLSEEELLMNMRKTTRYLIGQARNNSDIEIVKSNNTDDLEIYNKIMTAVANRRQFTPFSPKIVKAEFDAFSKDNQALLFFGKYKGEPAASALIIFWAGAAFYHQAALLTKYHKIPIAYLLQWEAIKEAQKRGCKIYDFWGYVDPKKYPKHSWAGPSLFKMGFGGKIYEYIKTQDLPLSKKYWLTYIFEKFRKIKRGL